MRVLSVPQASVLAVSLLRNLFSLDFGRTHPGPPRGDCGMGGTTFGSPIHSKTLQRFSFPATRRATGKGLPRVREGPGRGVGLSVCPKSHSQPFGLLGREGTAKRSAGRPGSDGRNPVEGERAPHNGFGRLRLYVFIAIMNVGCSIANKVSSSPRALRLCNEASLGRHMASTH